MGSGFSAWPRQREDLDVIGGHADRLRSGWLLDLPPHFALGKKDVRRRTL